MAYTGSSAVLTRAIIGDYSMDGRRRLHLDRRNLSRVNLGWTEKTVRFDLNEALSKARRRDIDAYSKEWLSNILEWLVHHPAHLIHAPHFVSARKTLRRVMLGACDGDERVFYAAKFRGTIYICATFEDDVARSGLTQDRMTSWGHKFEHFMADGSDPSTGMDENESYSCVVRAQMGPHSLIYKCEVDGVDSTRYAGQRLPLEHELVELKTQHIKCLRYGLNKYKLRDAWAQCTLAGVPRVVVGYRDDYGVVHNLKVLRVDDFPRLANNFFSPKEMLDLLNKFLEWVKTTVTKDDPNIVHEIKMANRSFRSRCLPAADAPVTVLHRWYVDKVNASLAGR